MARRRAIRSVKSIENKKKRLKKRQVLSYEDMPIDEYDEVEAAPDLKITKKTKQVFVIVLCLILAMVVWVNWDSLQPKNVINWVENSITGSGNGDGFPISIRGTEISNENFNLMDDEAVCVSDTSVDIITPKAKEVKNTQHSFNEPASKTAGEYAIIYNRGGTGYQVETNSKEIVNTDADNDIITASISSSGSYVIVTESKDYLATLTAYNSDNQEIYKYYFADTYVLDVDINADGNEVAVSTVQAKNGDVHSIIYVLNLKDTTPKQKNDIANNMVVNIDYMSDGNIALIGNKFASTLEPNQGKRIDYNYNDRELMAYTVNPDVGIGLALSSASDGRNCDFVLLDSSGTTQASFSTPYRVTSLSIYGNTIAMLSDGNIQAYNTKGDNWSSVEVGSDAKKILMYSSKNAYVLGASEIRRANI